MRGKIAFLLTGLLLTGCLQFDGGRESGVEQFVFEIVPGPAEVDRQMLSNMGEPGSQLGDVEVVGVVETPVGRMTIVDFTMTTPDGVRQICQGRFSSRSASASCGEGAPPDPQVEAGQVLVPGLGSDGTWVDLEIVAGDGVQSVRAVTDDGTVYRSNVVDNLAIVVYPEERGSVTITPLDGTGEPSGDPVRSELP